MMEWFAHSPKDGCPAQTYAQHIEGVVERTQRNAEEAARFAVMDRDLFISVTLSASAYHDLGKLDEENQAVLSGEKTSRRLPVNHVDAGSAFLLDATHTSPLAAITVASHHQGLPNFICELNRGTSMLRDDNVRAIVDAALGKYANAHDKMIHARPQLREDSPTQNLSVFLRLLLSCLVDADHTDTAVHYKKAPQTEAAIELQAGKRLAALDAYITKKGPPCNDRDRFRAEMYAACRDADVHEHIVACDAPVGTGKTTAIMAHLLAQANRRGLRRIFVVLPFTNIIQQSVQVYRDALVLPGENPEDVVAELHHRADFESEDTRHLASLWRAPIVVTTAVAFFETLSANTPAALRKLHALPGSAIFVDEAHAALPTQLLPLAWAWMNVYADEWSCYWVLASGSLNRFWEIQEIAKTPRDVPMVFGQALRTSLDAFEVRRIAYHFNPKRQSVAAFACKVAESPGPRLVIVNTVQSAAVLANDFKERFGQTCVEHLSTALLPKDRAATLARVKHRLGDASDSDWTLIATSCVEAGVDLSFRTGFRELASLTSLLQAAGRINRNGEYGVSDIHVFCLEESKLLRTNPALKNAAAVLREFFEKHRTIEPSLTTEAIEQELKQYGKCPLSEKLITMECNHDFPFVDQHFVVVDSDTCIAVVDDEIVAGVRSGKIDWRALQSNSLHIAAHKLGELGMKPIADDIYHWDAGYNTFIGYMEGVLDTLSVKSGVLIL